MYEDDIQPEIQVHLPTRASGSSDDENVQTIVLISYYLDSHAICFRMLILLGKKRVRNFEIAHKTWSILV